MAITADRFDRTGECVMGRMLGSSAAHAAMDPPMAELIGGGETQQRRALGGTT